MDALIDRAWALGQKDGKRALDLAERAHARTEGAPRGAALVILALRHRARGEHVEAGRRCEEALQLIDEQASPRTTKTALMILGAAQQFAGRLDQARECYERALTLQRRVCGDLAAPVNGLGTVHLTRGERGEAIRRFQEALALARSEGNRTVEALALGNLGNVCSRSGLHAAALEAYESAAVIHKDEGNAARLASIHDRVGKIYAECGDLDEALSCARKSLALARDAGDAMTTANALYRLGRIHVDRGEPAPALAALEESLSLEREHGTCVMAPWTLESMASAHRGAGDGTRADRCLQEGLALARRTGDPSAEAALLSATGEAQLQAGEAVAAVATLEQALALSEALKEHPQRAFTLRLLSDAHERAGDVRAALRAHRAYHAAEAVIVDSESDHRLRTLQVLHEVARERERADAAQHRVEEELRKLPRRLLAAQEEERRAVARELHDDVSQRLAALALDLSTLGDGKLGEVQDRLERLALDVHDLSRRIHPSIVQDLGLAQALRAECRRASEGSSWNVHYAGDQVPPSLSDEAALAAYRVTQEALRNAAKHAGATAARVTLAQEGGALVLRIRDDGAGFVTDEAGGGVGLAGMRERTELCGGRFTIDSIPGGGTLVEARFPLGGPKP